MITQWWGSLVAAWGEPTVLGSVAFLSYLLSWAICNVPYFVIDYYELFTKYKLQSVRPFPPHLTRRRGLRFFLYDFLFLLKLIWDY